MKSVRHLVESNVSEYVPYTYAVTPEIVSTKRLEYVTVIKLDGRSAIGSNPQEKFEWVEALNNTLKGLNAGDIAFYSHLIRKKVQTVSGGQFAPGFARDFDAAYTATFARDSLMINELYLSVLVRQAKDPVLNSLARFEKMTAAERTAWQAEAIMRLNETVRILCDALKRYGPTVLSIPERDGYAFCEPMEFVSELLNGRKTPVPVTREYLCDTLPLARPVFARWGELAELRLPDEKRFFGILEFRDFPDELKPGHLDDLLQSHHEFVLTQSWSGYTRADAISALKRHRKLMVDSKDESKSQISSLSRALDELSAGKWGFGEHHGTMLIWGSGPDDVRKRLSQSIGELAAVGIIARPADKSLEAAFWAQLPGNWQWRPRPMGMTSFNFLDLSSFHNIPSGKPSGNPWGPAVTLLKTEAGSPYWFNFHATEDDEDATGARRLGNTMVIGKSGTGKTVFLSHLLTQAQRFEPAVIVMDKDQGMHVTILALGGRYFTLRLGHATGWAPCQLSATESNMAFLRRFIAHLASCRGEPLSTREHGELALAINQMTSLIEPKDRSLTTLVSLLPNPRSTSSHLSIHERLLPWCQGGEYGWLFDGDQDSLNLTSHRIYGFDMTELLLDPLVRSSASMYLQHRWDEMADGQRVIQITDEIQHVLRDQFFQERLQDQARTVRKKNMLMANATQEPAAITENPIGRSLVQQAATAIYLPNPEATPRDYIDGFKLTQAEFELVKGLGEFSHKFVIKQGGRCSVAQLDLSGCPEALAVFSGNAKRGALAEELIRIHGDKPEDWLPHYLAALKAE